MSVTFRTSLGNIKLELFCDRAPRTCHNFLALAASGAYDGTLFHRSIQGFMIQGGDPTGKGKGGQCAYPDRKYIDDEIVESLRHDRRGILAMANRGPHTNGSQFYIIFAPQSHLDNVNSVFGRVLHGLDVLEAMEKVRVDDKHRPIKPITLLGVDIHANPMTSTGKPPSGAAAASP